MIISYQVQIGDYYKYNLRIKQEMKKIKIKQYQSQIFNKQNCNRQLTGNRHRNDHSIQAKSPIKIPIGNHPQFARSDLTFRIKTQPKIDVQINQELENMKGCGMQSSKISTALAKQSMKINIKSLNQTLNPAKEKITISQSECHLIDKLWEVCTKLSSYNNKFIKDHLSVIQTQIKKMLNILAQQNLQEAPLASSKKIKLQNCIAYSQCQKQIHHKEIQSDEQKQSNIEQNSCSFLQMTQNAVQQQQFKDHYPKNESGDQLQMRKIMYMLDQKNVCNSQKVSERINQKQSKTNRNMRNQGNTSCIVKSERLSQLSSFNQLSCDQSGFTLFEIQRCTERYPQYSQHSQNKKSKKTPNNSITHSNSIKTQKESSLNKQLQQDYEILTAKMRKKQPSVSSSQLSQNKIQSYQTYDSCSEQSSECMETNNVNYSLGNKRKVLNDIVTMLNQKYNKNIRLD